MKKSTEKKFVFVAGAAGAIGTACVMHLAGLGVEVFAGIRKPEDGLRLRAAAPDHIFPVLVDITRQDSVRSAREAITQILTGRDLWAIVNNAGIPLGGAIEFLPLDILRQGLEVNLIGHVSVIQAFMPLTRTAAAE